MSYKIVVLRDFYGGQYDKRSAPEVLETEGKKRIFATLQEAIDALMLIIDEPCHLAKDEVDRPEYYVLQSYTLISYDRESSMYNWAKSMCTRGQDMPCGECSDCINILVGQDRAHVRRVAIRYTVPPGLGMGEGITQSQYISLPSRQRLQCVNIPSIKA